MRSLFLRRWSTTIQAISYSNFMNYAFRKTLLLGIACSPLLLAGSWPTFGGDSQRSGWARDETEISRDSVKHFQLLWKLKVENEPKELNALTPPIAVNPVYTDRGAKSFVIFGGSSDNIYVVDVDTGKLVWNKHFENSAPPATGPQSSGSYFCPNALNDTPAVANTSAGPTVYIISIDGKLHALNLVTGADRFPPRAFVPAYSKNWSLNVVDNVVYTSTSQNCAVAKSGIWAMNLSNPDMPVTTFEVKTYGAGIWGRGGPTIGADGIIYTATGDGPADPAAGKFADSVLALTPKTLKLSDYFMPQNANYITRKDLDMGNSSPVVFSYKDRKLLVTGGKEGLLFLLDTKSLGGETHREPLYRTPLYANAEADIAGHGFWGAFASWEDGNGGRWVYAPAWGPINASAPAFPKTNGAAPNGSIMAFQIKERDGRPVLEPAWASENMSVPEPPVIANGVVLAISSGEFTRQVAPEGRLWTAQERIAKSPGNATLYALDATTGEELYSSGKAISSFTHLGGLAVSEGRVFVTTHDQTVYAFGVPGQ
jgi:outer membrane protein assembly factor BamB